MKSRTRCSRTSPTARVTGEGRTSDDWQIEVLCNLAAAEIVMPIGSMKARRDAESIEDLMEARALRRVCGSFPDQGREGVGHPGDDVLLPSGRRKAYGQLVVEELIRAGVHVTVYDPPPRAGRERADLFS